MARIREGFAAGPRELNVSFLPAPTNSGHETSKILIRKDSNPQPWEPIGLPLQSGADASQNCRHKHPLEDYLDQSLLRDETAGQTSIVALFDGHTNGQVAQLLSRSLLSKLNAHNPIHMISSPLCVGSDDSLSKLLKPLVKIGALLLKKSYFSSILQTGRDGERPVLLLQPGGCRSDGEGANPENKRLLDEAECESIIQLRRCMLLQSNLSLDILAWTLVLGDTFFAQPHTYLERIFADWDQLLLLKLANRQPKLPSLSPHAHIINFSSHGDDNGSAITYKLPPPHSRFGGCTATVCLIRDDTLHFCWLGDSRAGFFNATDGTLTTTRDHKPNNAEETARILAKGGSVVHRGVWRVEGRLAMSRSFGDFDLKRSASSGHLYDGNGWVSARPSYFSCSLRSNTVDTAKTYAQSLLLMASDGFWDVVSEEYVAEICRVYTSTEKQRMRSSSELACSLRQLAAERGSLDDITVFVATIDLSNNNNNSNKALP
jgi:serine/threonine protein phosphatase PrpC